MDPPPELPPLRAPALAHAPSERPTPAAPRPRFSVQKTLLLLLLLLTGIWPIALAAVGTWSSYWAEQRNDQYELIDLGTCVYNGQRMYVDCWENKPPGIAWINAIGVALSFGGQFAAWILPGLSLVLSLAIMTLAIRRVLSPIAAYSTLWLASAVATLRLYDTPSINPDFYAATFGLAAGSLWLLALDTERRGRRIWLGLCAGLFWAAATAVKQTGFVGLLAVSIVAIALAIGGRTARGRWLGASGVALIGFILGIGGVGAVLYHRQTLEPAWAAIFEFNRGLISWDALTGALASWSRAWTALAPLQITLWLALAGLITTLFAGKVNRLSRGFVMAMLLWWIVEVVLALLGPSRSMRYWQATWPAMLLLVGAGVYHMETVFRRLDRGLRSLATVICVTLVLLLGRPLFDQYTAGLAASDLASKATVTERDQLAAVGAELRALVPEPHSVYVWAYDAGMYVYSSRRPASRFTYPRTREQMDEILTDLETKTPYAFLKPQDESPAFDRWCDEKCEDRLAEVLERYTRQEIVGGYDAWVQPVSDITETPTQP